MKKLILIIISIYFLLSSCSSPFQNHYANTKNSNSKIALSDISEIYLGITQDINKYYSKIKIPNNINSDPPEKIYEFTMKYQNSKKDLSYAKKNAEKLNELFCRNNNIQKKALLLSESQLDYLTGENCKDYTLNCSVFGEFNCFNEKTYDNIYNSSELNLVKSYYLSRSDFDLTDNYTINDQSMTIEQISEKAEKFVNKDLNIFNADAELSKKLRDVYILKYGSKYAAKCKFEWVLENVPLMECDMMQYEKLEEGTEDFISLNLTVTMASSNTFDIINSNNCFELNNKNEISKIIPLKEAMNIVEQELADNLCLKIDEVNLVYCCKQAFHSESIDYIETLDSFDGNSELKFTPYWCFYMDDKDKIEIGNEHPRKCLLIDALKGDLSVFI